MALSKKTINKHNLKRAEVFAAHGLGDHDVRYAHPAFLGYGSSDCCLCDHKDIKWLFAIKFDAPDLTIALGKVATGLVRTEEVTLSPVGSKCITDWLDAVPESIEKLEALKRWATELNKCKAAMKQKVCEDLCAELCEERGLEIPEGSTAREVVFAAFQKLGWSAICQTIPYKGRKRFSKTAHKMRYGTCVRKTAQDWIKLLITALDKQAELDAKLSAKPAAEAAAAKPASPAAVAVSGLDDDLIDMKYPGEAELIQRGRDAWAAWDQKADPDRLKSHERSAFTGIGKKVVKYHSFVSSAQKSYYRALLAKLEKTTVADEAAAQPVATTVPGSADYVSASGIAGARY